MWRCRDRCCCAHHVRFAQYILSKLRHFRQLLIRCRVVEETLAESVQILQQQTVVVISTEPRKPRKSPFFVRHRIQTLCLPCRTATVVISMTFPDHRLRPCVELRTLSVPMLRFLWSNCPHSGSFVAPLLGPRPWEHSSVFSPPTLNLTRLANHVVPFSNAVSGSFRTLAASLSVLIC